VTGADSATLHGPWVWQHVALQIFGLQLSDQPGTKPPSDNIHMETCLPLWLWNAWLRGVFCLR